MPTKQCYVKVNEAKVYKSVIDDKPKTPINRLLLGTYIEVIGREGNWLNIKSINDQTGWIKESDTCNEAGLRCFFADVGQGDGILLEIGDIKIIIDGGKNASLKTFMSDWKYKYAIDKNDVTHINHLFITHLDDDHFNGLIELINDTNYTFENIYFAGISKFKEGKFNTKVGETVKVENVSYLKTIYETLDDIELDDKLNDSIKEFIEAVKTKGQTCPIKTRRLESYCKLLEKKFDNKTFKVEVLGPISKTINGKPYFIYFGEESKTINGHSLVLKITFESFRMLLGGDLNEKSQKYLIDEHKDQNENDNSFKADVYKVGHHGANDFSIEFLKWVSPKASVFSSGDNDTYGHPSATAIGCAGKYSSSMKPLVFSTELARSYSKDTILYGTIFLRSNGTQTYIAQMKEGGKESDPWEAYEVI